MFEKIFGIFRRGKKSDFSAEIPGETDEGDLFEIGDTGMDDDFDADTISLETGMSDSGFSDGSGGMASDPEFGDTLGGLDSGQGDEFGAGVGLEDEVSDMGALEEPITPPPEVEPLDAEPDYMAPAAKRSRKGLVVTIVVFIAGLVGGFLVATPESIEMINRAISSEPTVLEQIETLIAENTALDSTLKTYRPLGTVDEILVLKAELAKRGEISDKIAAIETKISDRPVVEDRLDSVDASLKQTRRRLAIQQGDLANVNKSLKQIEARNNYLTSSTLRRLDDLVTDTAKSEVLKARLDKDLVESAEAAATMTRDLQDTFGQIALDALSAL